MRDKMNRLEGVKEGKQHQTRSSLDLWRLMGGRSHRVRERDKKQPDSVLAVYSDRVTYTFIMDNEVASIHFDRIRKEIFFKGHNLHNFKPSEAQIKALYDMKGVLEADEKARPFISGYLATLGRLLADK